MKFRERLWRPWPPGTRYLLSVSRAGKTCVIALPPALLWCLAALVPASLAVGVAGAAYFAFHDAVARALIEHAAAAQATAEDRLAEERGRFDAVNSQRLIEHTGFERRLGDLLTREARLEQHDAIVIALASEMANAGDRSAMKRASNALQAIEITAPSKQPTLVRRTENSAIISYAPAPDVEWAAEPAKPLLRPATLTVAAMNPEIDAKARLDLAGMALTRLESGQMVSLASIDRAAADAFRRKSAILAEAGLDPGRFASAKAVVHAPLASVELGPDAPPFDRTATRVFRDVANVQELHTALAYAPLRKPLLGDAEVTSPFGYRRDPFLGRPMLHPGVDLLETYGAQVHATGAGRVVHAGSAGGYGTMVEIDHGGGLMTRYAHLSEVDVQEGQEVIQGAVLGRLGSTGRSTGPHLHYEVRVEGEPVDPGRFLRAGEGLDEAN